MSHEKQEALFTAQMETHSFAGILLDLDGTLVDSTNAVVKHWHKSVDSAALQDVNMPSMLMFDRIGKEVGVDPNVILASAHGRRSIDTLQLYDPSKANWDCQSTLHVLGSFRD